MNAIPLILNAVPRGETAMAAELLVVAERPRAEQEVYHTADELALAFRGLEMVDPGLTLVSEWRPDGTGPRPLPWEVNAYGGVARKP